MKGGAMYTGNISVAYCRNLLILFIQQFTRLVVKSSQSESKSKSKSSRHKSKSKSKSLTFESKSNSKSGIQCPNQCFW